MFRLLLNSPEYKSCSPNALDYSVEMHKVQRSRQGWKRAIRCDSHLVLEKTTQIIVPWSEIKKYIDWSRQNGQEELPWLWISCKSYLPLETWGWSHSQYIVTHSLIVTFPVFIKDFKQPPLSLFEIETVAMPIHNKNRQADSYSQVRIHKLHSSGYGLLH